MRIRYCSSDVCSSDLPSRGEELGGTEGAWSRVDDASLIQRELPVSGSARYVSAVLAQIRGIYLDLQLTLAVRRYGELAAARSDERRGGKACVRTVRSLWLLNH